MKIEMIEHFQGRGAPTLGRGQVCEVGKDVSAELAEWLTTNGKAKKLKEAPKPEPQKEIPKPEPQVVEKPKTTRKRRSTKK